METQEKTAASKAEAANEGLDAIKLLKSQHREVEALFNEIESAGDRAVKTKEKLYQSIRDKLMIHTKIEEKIFYPAAKEADEDLVLEAWEEHDNVKSMLRKLDKTGGDEESFDAKIKVLKELVRHHVKEEETELFPKCRNVLDDEMLRELGAKMQARSERLVTEH